MSNLRIDQALGVVACQTLQTLTSSHVSRHKKIHLDSQVASNSRILTDLQTPQSLKQAMQLSRILTHRVIESISIRTSFLQWERNSSRKSLPVTAKLNRKKQKHRNLHHQNSEVSQKCSQINQLTSKTLTHLSQPWTLHSSKSGKLLARIPKIRHLREVNNSRLI